METQNNAWFSVSPFRARNGAADRDLGRLLAGMTIPTRPVVPSAVRSFAPAIDVLDDGEHFLLTMEVPGLGIGDIDVEVEPTRITVSGEKAAPEFTDDEPPTVLIGSRAWGTFERTVKLPCKVSETKAKASMKNGVLTVVLPKLVEKPKVRKLTIEDAS